MNWKKLIISLLRCSIGWHFIYEGFSKLVAENWTAAGFLSNATGPFAGFYHWLASSQTIMKVIDPVNMYGLILIGLGLFLGLAIRYSAIGGIVLLTLYYFAYPPFGGSLFGSSSTLINNVELRKRSRSSITPLLLLLLSTLL